MDTRQLTSSQGEADGVSEWEYDIAGVGGGEFALWLVPRQRAAPFYRRTRTHTHTHTLCVGISTVELDTYTILVKYLARENGGREKK